jgi:hypothetical protein
MRKALLLALVLLVPACGDDDTATTTTTTTGTTTTGVAPTTTAAATTTIAPTTTTACVFDGDTASKQERFPDGLSSLYGTDIRVGGHECYERVVIELGGTGDFPGWRVEYTDEVIPPSGIPVEMGFPAVLDLRVLSWMPTMEGQGYDGPTDFRPTTVSAIGRLVQYENFEGNTAWAVGLDRERAFTVTTLADPPRLVVDVEI